MTAPNAGKDLEKLGHSHIAGGYVKWYSHCGEQFGSLKTGNRLVITGIKEENRWREVGVATKGHQEILWW